MLYTMSVRRTKRTPLRDCYTLNIAKRRAELGMSQHDLARACGLKRLSISCYENGYHEPGLQALIQLATALHCTLEQLVTVDAKAASIVMFGQIIDPNAPAAEVVLIEVGSAPVPVAPDESPSSVGEVAVPEEMP